DAGVLARDPERSVRGGGGAHAVRGAVAPRRPRPAVPLVRSSRGPARGGHRDRLAAISATPGGSVTRRTRTAGHALALAVAALYSVFPIYFITVQSLKTPQEDVFGSPLWVRHPTFENYEELFAGAAARVRGFVIVPRVPFLQWLGNSAIVLALS